MAYNAFSIHSYDVEDEDDYDEVEVEVSKNISSCLKKCLF